MCVCLCVCVCVCVCVYNCLSLSSRIINDFFLISLYISTFPTMNLIFENRQKMLFFEKGLVDCNLKIMCLTSPVLCWAQLCLTLCDPMDCSLPVSSVHGILQARILEWGAMPCSRGSSYLRDRTQVCLVTGGFFTV